MKIFAFILSIIILGLTASPCIDKPVNNELQKTELSQNNTNNHSNDSDHCSPFCNCQCCQTNCYVANISVNAPAIALEIRYNEDSNNFQSIDLFDFLIPPKA